MLKSKMSRIFPEGEGPVWRLFFFGLAVFIAAILIGLWLSLKPNALQNKYEAYQPTDDGYRVRVEVGGTLFAIPAHYTRSAQTRSQKAQNFVELHALLPDLKPYSRELDKEFLRIDAASRLVIITLRASERPLPERRIFEDMLSPFVLGSGDVRDDGLQLFKFQPDSPYAGKELFRALPLGPRAKRLAPPLFICDTVDTPSPTCESSYDLGRTAQANYSFKRAYLSDWETIDGGLRDMITSFRAAARAR